MTRIKTSIIPFNVAFIAPSTYSYIDQALGQNNQQGGGKFSELVESHINGLYPSYGALLTPSCTAALELSLLLLDLGPGDEVIVPSFTFPSVVTAITKVWGKPVFADIDLRTGCIDVSQIEKLITPKTRAISWVNYGGIFPNRAELHSLARRYDLFLIEDAAHNFGVETHDFSKDLSDFKTFSFHSTKNLQCGEGGALLIKDPALLERAHIMREKGTNRIAFSRGKVSKYQWVDRGSSYLLAEVNAAILYAQLQCFDEIQGSRQEVVLKYKFMSESVGELGIDFLSGVHSSSHLFAMLLPNLEFRDQFIQLMSLKGIAVSSHYEDLASSSAARRFGFSNQRCSGSEQLSSRLARLPVYPSLGQSTDWICEELDSTLHMMNHSNPKYG